MNFKRKKGGFTLVEALIATTILIVGILSAFILVTRALYNAAVIQDRLTASFLAQEGVELVRQIRDTNFIQILNGQNNDWLDGLDIGSYIVEADLEGGSVNLMPLDENEAPDLFRDRVFGNYDYDNSEYPTSFNRKIIISSVEKDGEIIEDQIRVEVIMKWQTRHLNFDLTVEDRLFNWLKI